MKSMIDMLNQSGANSRLEGDSKTFCKFIIIDNVEAALSAKDVIQSIVGNSPEVAQVGDYVSIKIDDSNYIHIHDADIFKVVRDVLDDKTDYKFSVTFKNAEFHAYMGIENLETHKAQHIGASVKPFGAWNGDLFIRDDNPYDTKYFRGHEVPSQHKYHIKRDKASFSVKLLIKEDQFNKLETKFQEDAEKLGTSGNGQYSFMGGNCHDYMYAHYKNMGFTGHHYKFAKSDDIDLLDQGAAYSFLLAHGWFQALAFSFHETLLLADHHNLIPSFIPDFILRAVGVYRPACDFKEIFYTSLTDMKLAVDLAETQDEYGNTALHQALIMKDISQVQKLLDLGVDVNIPNYKGEIALHLAAGLPRSEAKIELLKYIISKTIDINIEDDFSDCIPLSMAVLSNDPDAIELLVQHGANYRFINSSHDMFSNLVAEGGKIEAAIKLFEIDPDQFMYDNGTRQYPLHHHNFHGIFDNIPDNAPKPKDELGLYLHILNPSEFFAELHNFSEEIVI